MGSRPTNWMSSIPSLVRFLLPRKVPCSKGTSEQRVYFGWQSPSWRELRAGTEVEAHGGCYWLASHGLFSLLIHSPAQGWHCPHKNHPLTCYRPICWRQFLNWGSRKCLGLSQVEGNKTNKQTKPTNQPAHLFISVFPPRASLSSRALLLLRPYYRSLCAVMYLLTSNQRSASGRFLCAASSWQSPNSSH